MRIDFIETLNFRRLASVRIDFSERTTLFVGANNSGKTSAISALRYFLIKRKDFSIYDIPVALWKKIDELGEEFGVLENTGLDKNWKGFLPSLDIWLNVSENEIHHVAHLIPTLDWSPGQGIGVRLQLEPKNPEELQKEYITAKKASCDTLDAEKAEINKDSQSGGENKEKQTQEATCSEFSLWPESLMDFLKKRMSGFLTVNAYLLDPSKKAYPIDGVAQIQELPDDAEPLDEEPFKGLIQIDEVPAHRGLSDYAGTSGSTEEPDQNEKGRKQLLTAQLRSYYGKHLDPSKAPEPSDIRALRAIHEAQIVFDERLRDYFKTPLCELEDLGYPGIANPRLIISTSIKPVEGLKHQSAVQYDVAPTQSDGAVPYRLPEQCNGLGYQNLISMVFRLISFRDDWMKVGKAAHTDDEIGAWPVSPPPLHLVLLEEPEVHLHVQVQQVFIRKAYEVLRNHLDLKEKSTLSTQLVVSTHSSHIAHEVEFAYMRYFRRHPASNPKETPSSTVINLSEVFGTEDETARFVSRYLKATHSDLFFADGAIMVEGAAERMLVPHFIRNYYEKLHTCYVTLLEVGGSHAHRLAPLIKHLGLNTLIITDLDAVKDATNRPKARPEKGAGLLTGNSTLKKLHPEKESIDELLELSEDDKEKVYDDHFSIRVTYQTPVKVVLNKNEQESEGIPRTFEDALVFANIDTFREADGTGLLKKFQEAVSSKKDVSELAQALFNALESGNKAEFALDMLYFEDPAKIKVPEYIQKGLKWLENKLFIRQQEVLLKQDGNTKTP